MHSHVGCRGAATHENPASGYVSASPSVSQGEAEVRVVRTQRVPEDCLHLSKEKTPAHLFPFTWDL